MLGFFSFAVCSLFRLPIGAYRLGMCSFRKGVTVFPISDDDMLVMLPRGRGRSSSSGRRRLQLLFGSAEGSLSGTAALLCGDGGVWAVRRSGSASFEERSAPCWPGSGERPWTGVVEGSKCSMGTRDTNASNRDSCVGRQVKCLRPALGSLARSRQAESIACWTGDAAGRLIDSYLPPYTTVDGQKRAGLEGGDKAVGTARRERDGESGTQCTAPSSQLAGGQRNMEAGPLGGR